MYVLGFFKPTGPKNGKPKGPCACYVGLLRLGKNSFKWKCSNLLPTSFHKLWVGRCSEKHVVNTYKVQTRDVLAKYCKCNL